MGPERCKGAGRASGREGTNIVSTPRAVTNDSIDAQREKLEPEEKRRSFTGTEEPTCLPSAPLSSSPIPPLSFYVSWPVVDVSRCLLRPSRSLSPEVPRNGRSESVATDLWIMKLMPNATGGCGPAFLIAARILGAVPFGSR